MRGYFKLVNSPKNFLLPLNLSMRFKYCVVWWPRLNKNLKWYLFCNNCNHKSKNYDFFIKFVLQLHKSSDDRFFFLLVLDWKHILAHMIGSFCGKVGWCIDIIGNTKLFSCCNFYYLCTWKLKLVKVLNQKWNGSIS